MKEINEARVSVMGGMTISVLTLNTYISFSLLLRFYPPYFPLFPTSLRMIYYDNRALEERNFE